MIILFLFSISAIKADSITGLVKKERDNRAIEFANVMLLSTLDSTFIAGTVTDVNGLFLFENVNKGNYIIKVSFVSYHDYYGNILLNERLLNVGNIFLKDSSTLNEIIITTQNTPFKSSINGGIITNVSTTLLNSVGTANDVIKRIPGITLSDDNISVFGKGIPIIYINNRKIEDQKELERLESSEISTVELITNPSAKYNAEGRAVLVINTKKKYSGFSTQVTTRFRQGIYGGSNENLNISYLSNKWSLYGSYYHMYGKMKTDEYNKITLVADSSWMHDINSPYMFKNNTHQISTGLDWNLTDKHAIGGQYQYYFQSSNDNSDIKGTSSINNKPYENYIAGSLIKENPYRHLINAFYKGSYGEKWSLLFDFDFIMNHNERNQNTMEYIATGSRSVNLQSESDYSLYAAKATNSYKSDIGLIEFGGEYNRIRGKGFILNKEGYTKNNIYTTFERKSATFINYSREFENINFSVGLRYEYTFEKSTEDSTEMVNTDKKYSAFYPSLSISKKINNLQLSFNSTKRVRRPNFSDLNGNTVYLNRYVLQTGNPYLEKTNIYDINMTAIYKMFYMDIGYTYEKDPITFYYGQQDNAESILLSIANFPKYQELNAILSFKHTIGFWQPNYTITMRKPFFTVDYLSRKEKYNSTDFSIRSYNDFDLPNNFTFSLNFNYQTNNDYYLMKRKHSESIDIGIRKSFIDNQLKVNFETRDVFNWVSEKNTVKVNNICFDQSKKRESQYVILSIVYQFNNYKKRYRGDNAAKEDIDRL